jgi:hypothetical protein
VQPYVADELEVLSAAEMSAADFCASPSTRLGCSSGTYDVRKSAAPGQFVAAMESLLSAWPNFASQ